MKVTTPILAAALVLSVLPGLPAGEAPPYPYAPPSPPSPPAWKAALQKKLEEAKCTLTFEKEPLRSALEKLSAASKVSFEVAPDAREAAESLVDLTCKEMGAIDVLGQLLTLTNLAYELTERGVLVVPKHPTEDDGSIALQEIGERIEYMRSRRFPTKEEKAAQEKSYQATKKWIKAEEEKYEKVRGALRSAKLDKDLVDVEILDVLRVLKETSKVEFILTKEAQEKIRSSGKVTMKAGSRSAEMVLKDVLSPLGLEIEIDIRSGVCLIIEAGKGHKQYYWMWSDEERKRGETKIFAAKLTKELKGSRPCDFAGVLSEDLGIEVFPDIRSWGVEVKLPPKTTGLTVRQLAAVLKKKGIELVVDASATDPRMVPSDRPWGPPTKIPPGTPEAKWAIYLITPKK